jgi:hypothetical protein
LLLYHESASGCVAAAKLLSYLPRITHETLTALQRALDHTYHVQQEVVQVLLHIRAADINWLDGLIELIEHPSALIAYMAANVLSLIGRNENTDPDQRRRIVQVLTAAHEAPHARRGLYMLIGKGEYEQLERLQLVHTGSLGQIFFRALIEVSGIH